MPCFYLSSSLHLEGSYCHHLVAPGEVWYMYTDVSEELAPSFSIRMLMTAGFVETSVRISETRSHYVTEISSVQK